MKRNFIWIIGLILSFSLSGCYLVQTSGTYYGVDIGTAKRVVFLLDISGSMEGKAETDLEGNVVGKATSYVGDKVSNKVGGLAGRVISNQTNNQLTKLGKAKKELIPSIRGLKEDAFFTIIIFENKVKKWRKGLVQATSANKNLAIAYLNKLHSGGATNIYGSLEEAFDLAGEGATDDKKPLGVETIFLLSDGSPTVGAIRTGAGIIAKAKEWNPNKRVVIHTIGLGEDCDKVFMKKLAEDNRGQFIDK